MDPNAMHNRQEVRRRLAVAISHNRDLVEGNTTFDIAAATEEIMAGRVNSAAGEIDSADDLDRLVSACILSEGRWWVVAAPVKRGRKPGPMCRIDPLGLATAMHVVGMNAAELADVTGLSDQTIKRLLTGGTTTARSIADALATALEVDVERLVIA